MKKQATSIKKRQLWSWLLYDWANSVFATIVVAGFFPIFFKQHLSSHLSVNQSTFYLGLTSSAVGFLLTLLAPFLGGIADRGGYKKIFLVLFMILGVSFTAMLAVLHGDVANPVLLGLIFYGAAVLGFAGANVFYDALLADVASPQKLDRVSAQGFAVGYLGGGAGFLLCVIFYAKPNLLGFASSVNVMRFSFVFTALWWFVFSLPLVIFIKSKVKKQIKQSHLPKQQALKKLIKFLQTFYQHAEYTFKNLHRTFLDALKVRALMLFIIAYFFYIDGVNTIMKMAVDYGLSIGLQSTDLILALLIVQFISFPFALLFGYLAEKWSVKNSLMIAVFGYSVAVGFGYFIKDKMDLYFFATIIAVSQGGVQSLSRSMYLRLIDKKNVASLFGLYNVLGKLSTIIGPVLMGYISYATGNARLSMLSLLVFFIIGIVLLANVRLDEYNKK